MWRCAVWSITTNISEDTVQIQAVVFHNILLRETLKMCYNMIHILKPFFLKKCLLHGEKNPDYSDARSAAKLLYQLSYLSHVLLLLFFPWLGSLSGPRPPHFLGYAITLRHTTLCRNPLDNRSARRRGLHLTTYNTHKRQTSMPPAGFKPAIPTSERP